MSQTINISYAKPEPASAKSTYASKVQSATPRPARPVMPRKPSVAESEELEFNHHYFELIAEEETRLKVHLPTPIPHPQRRCRPIVRNTDTPRPVSTVSSTPPTVQPPTIIPPLMSLNPKPTKQFDETNLRTTRRRDARSVKPSRPISSIPIPPPLPVAAFAPLPRPDFVHVRPSSGVLHHGFLLQQIMDHELDQDVNTIDLPPPLHYYSISNHNVALYTRVPLHCPHSPTIFECLELESDLLSPLEPLIDQEVTPCFDTANPSEVTHKLDDEELITFNDDTTSAFDPDTPITAVDDFPSFSESTLDHDPTLNTDLNIDSQPPILTLYPYLPSSHPVYNATTSLQFHTNVATSHAVPPLVQHAMRSISSDLLPLPEAFQLFNDVTQFKLNITTTGITFGPLALTFNQVANMHHLPGQVSLELLPLDDLFYTCNTVFDYNNAMFGMPMQSRLIVATDGVNFFHLIPGAPHDFDLPGLADGFLASLKPSYYVKSLIAFQVIIESHPAILSKNAVQGLFVTWESSGDANDLFSITSPESSMVPASTGVNPMFGDKLYLKVQEEVFHYATLDKVYLNPNGSTSKVYTVHVGNYINHARKLSWIDNHIPTSITITTKDGEYNTIFNVDSSIFIFRFGSWIVDNTHDHKTTFYPHIVNSAPDSKLRLRVLNKSKYGSNIRDLGMSNQHTSLLRAVECRGKAPMSISLRLSDNEILDGRCAIPPFIIRILYKMNKVKASVSNTLPVLSHMFKDGKKQHLCNRCATLYSSLSHAYICDAQHVLYNATDVIGIDEPLASIPSLIDRGMTLF